SVSRNDPASGYQLEHRAPGAGFGDGGSPPRQGRALMSSRVFPILIAVGVLLLVAATSLFTVNQAQLAIRTEFGAIVTSQYAPGLHVKWPWDQVVTFDRRILSQTYTGETF